MIALLKMKLRKPLYQKVVEDFEQEITERVKVFYLPQKPAIRESGETAKLRNVYDASSKPTKKSVTVNDCLEMGPFLQN